MTVTMFPDWYSSIHVTILVLFHWVSFVTDMSFNNFFPFSQILGTAYDYDIVNNTYRYANYTYVCRGLTECSEKLCIASNMPTVSQITLKPIVSSTDCSSILTSNAWIYTMFLLLILETLLTLWWIFRKRCDTCLCDRRSLLIMTYYLAVNIVMLLYGPISILSARYNQPILTISIVGLRFVFFLMVWMALAYDISKNKPEEENELLS